MTIRCAGILWLVILCALAAPAAAQEAAPPPPGQPTPTQQSPSLLSRQQQLARQAELVGRWSTRLGGEEVDLILREDGSYSFQDMTGAWDVIGKTLQLSTREGVVEYTYSLEGNQLTLSGGGLTEDLVLTHRVNPLSYVADLFDVSRQELWERGYRILFIVLVVIAAQLLIVLLRGISNILINFDWGPLGKLYPYNKKRSRTLHLLTLNLVKYFIYFTALGMILGELGVNFATYFASLSVIGLAIGFGSQGLVQDMVTGFFIIFEGQFDVGDMVEISGQTGIVTELGLRMTKLRNYFGQIVVIPNRNIAVVGNYSRGAQRAYVDVQVENAAAAEKAMPLLTTLGQELMKQYPGVVLGPTKTTGPMTLDTGEEFVRLHLSIWPGQTWVIDQQLLPRLREQFAKQEITLISDRVQVFYHAREPAPVGDWRSKLPWPRRPA